MSLMSLATGLVHACLVLFDPPANGRSADATTAAARGQRIPLQFNPEQLAVRRSASWNRPSSIGGTAVTQPEFAQAGPTSLSMQLFLDATTSRGRTVEHAAAALLDCCRPARGKTSPRWVILEWGTSTLTRFPAVITAAGVTYTLFAPDGTPLRAEATVELEEVGGPLPLTNPTSGGTTFAGALAVHHFTQGDTLAGLAYRYYGDPAAWRHIATANPDTATDPLSITPGTVLVLPCLPDTQPGPVNHG
ncbi:tail protein X [Streptomyces sp. NPDC051555]|uniref:CIS tube protein n=1 Tax=Streptomyces sp. NPDC051555 TaxID=3365657 RepID=UPI0037A96697